MRKYLVILIILLFIVIDWFFFHDLLEPKKLPEFLTGLVSILVFALLATDFLKRGKKEN